MILRGSSEPSFVLLSIVIAIATAYAALSLAGRATVARGRVRVAWILGGAVLMGIGVNGMHFVGMLGYHLPVPILYNIPTVLAALLAAILASAVTLFVVSRPEMRHVDALIGSLFMGCGIATMHYTGMAAMRVSAHAHYDPLLVTLSVVIAIGVSLVGLWLVFYLRDPSARTWWWRVGGAVVMGVAIPSMHYVAMVAVEYAPATELPDVSYAIQISSLGAILIGIATLSTVLSAVLTSMFDRHLMVQATALAESEERLKAVAETAADAIVSGDHHGHIIYFNPAAERIFGYAPHEVIGRPLTLLMPERFHEAHQQGMARFLQTGDARVIGRTVELVGQKKEGTEFPLELSLAPWKARGDTFFTGIIRDITARKQAEKALKESEAQFRQAQKMESVGQLAGGIAHDFNNLLTVINSYSDMLLFETVLSSPLQHTGLTAIREAGQDAATLTQQLLAFSRQQVLEPKVLDLNVIVPKTMKLVRRLIGENITLTVCLNSNLGQVSADPGQIEQVIMNLAVNARDAMPQGGQLTIETTNVELDDTSLSNQDSVSPGPYVMLAIRDSGCGMDVDTQARMFDPFFTTKDLGRGTGLGLSTVYGIVKQSGGHLDVSSEVGQGSIFRVYLPRAEDEAQVSEPAPARPEALRGTETILLVEDEEMVRAVGQDILQRHGYTILAAREAMEALQLAEKHQGPIHLLFTDMMMPGLSGPELAERLAFIRPETKVLHTSGYLDRWRTQHHSKALSTAFLQKPYTPETLTHKIREVLGPPRTHALEAQIGRRCA